MINLSIPNAQDRTRQMRGLLMLCVLLTVACAFFLGHVDFRVITRWSTSFWDCLLEGQIASYPAYMEARVQPNNYTLAVSLLCALLISPGYFLSGLTGADPYPACAFLWKTALLAGTYFCCRSLRRILLRLNAGEKRANAGVVLFLTSVMLLLSNIGKGQVDLLSCLFLLLAMEAFLDGRYARMSFLAGVGALAKPFLLIFLVTTLLLLWYRDKKRVLLFALLAVLPWVADRTVTTVLFPDYYVRAKAMEAGMGYNFFGRLFEVGFSSVSLFLLAVMAVCFLCLHLSRNGSVKPCHFLLMPAVLYTAFCALVYWHSNWILPLLPVLVILCCLLPEPDWGCLLLTGTDAGFLVYVLLAYNTKYAVSAWLSPMDSLLGTRESRLFIGDFLNAISVHCLEIGKTAMIACLIALLFLFVRSTVRPEQESGFSPDETHSAAILPEAHTDKGAEEATMDLSFSPWVLWCRLLLPGGFLILSWLVR